MNSHICIHGHFYQPPRENPWLEEVELQDSAYPYHDWNERITAECYAPNGASRILDANDKIVDIINNYSKISFNFGPTLLSWMERHAPEVYLSVIEADKESRKNFSGHGSAIAQVYNHMIMPLACARDKRTQVVWGIKDFQHRFGRMPEGMWLAETAVDLETLDLLAEHGILFTILAQHQAGRVRKIQGRKWGDVSGAQIDPRRPYLCRLPSGREISLFFYDGPISQDMAFGGLLDKGEKFADRLLGAFDEERDQPQLIHIAADGETYGHHHRFGEMALSYCLHHIESNQLARVTVYGEYLERFPPAHEVEIVEDSSWSCIHGIERWRSDCGCNSGRKGWTQKWREPLRESLDWLRDTLCSIYEIEASPYLRDPWLARDAYIDVLLDRSREKIESFFSTHRTRELTKEERVKVFKLLEMQRHAMLMYTSCGWFFDEISGIETTQVLQYAARAIQLAERTSGARLEETFLEMIRSAPSNIAELADGARVYAKYVKPAIVDLLRVGAHYAISSLFEDYPEEMTIYAYRVNRESYELKEAGRQKMALGKIHMRSGITESEQSVSFAVLHLGDHNLVGGVREYIGDESFDEMRLEIIEAFRRSDVPEIIHLMDEHFETHKYSLWHLFKDEQRKVFRRILESTLEEIRASFRQIYDHHYPVMQVMRELNTPVPKALRTTAEFTIDADLQKALAGEELDLKQLRNLVEEVNRWSFEVDKTTLGFLASRRIEALMEKFYARPEDATLLMRIEAILRTLNPLSLKLDLWKSQKLYFSIGKRLQGGVHEIAESGDLAATEWLEHFRSLGNHLGVKIA